MAQVKLVFYLPLRDNDARELRPEIDEFELDLGLRFGGWSMVGVVKGTYLMADRTLSYDESNAYELVTDESRAEEVRDLLRAFKAKTTQEALYFEVQYNTAVEFI